MDNAVMVAAVNKYVEAFANSDMDLIREIYADNATVEDPVGSEVLEGIAAIEEFYTKGFQMGATLELTGPCRCAGSSVAFPFQVNAGGSTISIIDVFDFNDDGKVVAMRAYWGPDNFSQ